MNYKAPFLLALILSGTAVFGQTKSVKDLYLDFSLARIGSTSPKAMEIGEQILNHPEKLSPKTQVNFYYHLAKQYEVNHQDDKAVEFYQKVLAAEPDYYVPHMALGYLYLKPANQLVGKINASKNNKTLYQKYVGHYQELLVKSIRHLERAQACDPDEQLLAHIKDLYSRLQNKSGLATLDSRLQLHSRSCITVLTDDPY
jgi:tetratricopeptide (TPR) repeat protein